MTAKPATSRRKSGQEAPAAGSTARPLRGRYYEVTPATEDGPEYFAQPGLSALNAALVRANFLAFSPVQEVIVHPGSGPAKVLWRFEHGSTTLRPACIVPARQQGTQRAVPAP